MRRLLKMSPRLHKRAYDFGTVAADVGRTSALLTFRGGKLFTNPTWQWLQCCAQRAAFEMAGDAAPRLLARTLGRDGFELSLELAA